MICFRYLRRLSKQTKFINKITTNKQGYKLFDSLYKTLLRNVQFRTSRVNHLFKCIQFIHLNIFQHYVAKIK